MKQNWRLSAAGVKEVFKKGQTTFNQELILKFLKAKAENSGNNKLAISVSSKIGSAVRRNRIKRLLREAYRRNYLRMRPNHHLVLIAKEPLKDKNLLKVEESVLNVLKKARLLEENIENRRLKFNKSL